MIIKRIDAVSFGGLHNFTLEPTKGLNLIYGENEKGKSTLMAFLRMMFYGNEGKKSQASAKLRKKYTPLDGSRMQGRIEFEHGGRRYRLEREFRKSNTTDLITLYDLDLGEKKTVDSNVGQSLFGLSAGAFERSIFIGQFGFPESDTVSEGELNSRLANMTATGEESVSYEEVAGRLTKSRYELISKTGRGGEKEKTDRAVEKIRTEYRECLAYQSRFFEKKEKRNDFAAETEELNRKAEEMQALLAGEQEEKDREKLTELLTLKKRLETVRESLTLTDGTPCDDSFLRKLQFCAGKTESAREKLEAKLNEKSIIAQHLSDLEKLGADDRAETGNSETNGESVTQKLAAVTQKAEAAEQELAAARQRAGIKAKRPFHTGLLIAGCVLLAVCAVVAVAFAPIPGWIGVAAGAVTAILAFIIRPEDRAKNEAAHAALTRWEAACQALNQQKQELTEEQNHLAARSEAFHLAADQNTALRENSRNQLAECSLAADALQKDLQIQRDQLLALTALLGISELEEIPDMIQKLNRVLADQKEIKNRMLYLQKDLKNISPEEAKARLAKQPDSPAERPDYVALRQEYDRLCEQLNQRRQTQAGMEAELDTLAANSRNPHELERRLKAAKALSERQKEFCDAADIAAEVLLDSYAELRRDYGSVLEKKAAEIFSGLTGSKYTGVNISRSFAVSVSGEEMFVSREADYLSNGTLDQVYLSLRLAIAQLMKNGEEPLPLFLDDALAQYDDERAKKALAFLSDYGRRSQVLLFTCHRSLCDLAGENSTPVIAL